MFKRIVKNFGPKWGAAVMGTAALCITMQLFSEIARPFSVLLYVGLGFYLLATVMFITFLIPFLNKEMRLNDANFSWFIPPVSHLIILVLGTCLLDVY